MFQRQLKLIKDESVSSYIFRLARANYYGSADYVITKLGGTNRELASNMFHDHSIGKLSSVIELTHQQLNTGNLSKYNREWTADLSNKILMNRFVKYCPYCIDDQEMPYHKWKWGIHPVTVCIDHKCFFIDRCLKCDQRITMASLMNDYCLCGNSYKTTNENEQNVNNELFDSQVWLQNVLMNISNKTNFLNQFSFVDFIHLAYRSFHLLEGLGSFCGEDAYKIESFHNKKDKLHGNYKYAMAFGNVYWMYQNFPINFYKVLEAFQQKKNGQLKYMQKNQFEELFKNDKFKFIKQTYDSYWVEKYDEGSISTNFSVFKNEKSLLDRRKTISKEELKKVTGWSYPTIELLTSNNSLIVDEVKRGNNKRFVINKESIKKIKNRQMAFINQQDTANILGITRAAVAKLIDAELLQLSKTPKNQIQIKKQSIKNLEKICQGIPTNELNDKISFRDSLNKYSVNGLTIVHLIQWMITKHITPYSTAGKNELSELYFNKYELTLCLKKLKMEFVNENGYFFSDVCKLLKIGEKTMWLYVQHEILVPDKTEIWKDGRKRYFFKKQKIDKFINDHITIRDAATRYNIPQHTIRNWFKKGLIRDASRGVSKSYLINVQDIIKQIKLCHEMVIN